MHKKWQTLIDKHLNLIKIDIESKMIKFWANLVQPTNIKLSTKLYYVIYSLNDNFNNRNNNNNNKKYTWFYNIEDILIKVGMYGVWLSHSFCNARWLSLTVTQKLKDLFINDWFNVLNTSTSFRFYKTFKLKFEMEGF